MKIYFHKATTKRTDHSYTVNGQTRFSQRVNRRYLLDRWTYFLQRADGHTFYGGQTEGLLLRRMEDLQLKWTNSLQLVTNGRFTNEEDGQFATGEDGQFTGEEDRQIHR